MTSDGRRMMRKTAILILTILAAAGAVTCGMAAPAAYAEDPGGQSAVSDSEKLDAILQGQKAISEDLASIKEDLRIIKIRVTQSQ